MVSWPRNIHQGRESGGYEQNGIAYAGQCPLLWCPQQKAEVCKTELFLCEWLSSKDGRKN